MKSWLVSIREDKGFSQKYVSEKIGISQPSYCNIENGKNMPAVKTAKAIGALLGFRWTRFFEDGEPKQEQ